MSESRSFENCTVIIHDENNEHTLAKTTILSHNKTERSISVSSNVFTLDDVKKVSLLIFQDDIIIESLGTVRKSRILGRRDIALYKARPKESRQAKRYPINAPIEVTEIIVGDQPILLPAPISVILVNISTSGGLLKAYTDILIPDTQLDLKLSLAEGELSLRTTILRISEDEDGGKLLGCRFDFVHR